MKPLCLALCLLAIVACDKPRDSVVQDDLADLAVVAVERLAMQPVAAQYDVSMARQRFGQHLSDQQLQALALLDDWGWLPKNWASLDAASLLSYLNQRQTDLLAPTENYLGLSSDVWLQERLLYKLDRADYSDANTDLTQWLDKQVSAKLLSGYNLSRKADAPGFEPTLSVYYGHSNSLHLRQMLALLEQQSLLAKVALVPKRSVFVYLPEWGDAEYAVETAADGSLLARADEYNLYLSFFSAPDRQHFLSLVQRYAKRDASGASAILSASWWQPFLATSSAAKGYSQVYQVIAESPRWRATAITTKSNIKLTSPAGITTRIEPVWVNPAFYRYLTGQSHN